MIPVLLTRIKTRDGVTLDGIYVKPKRKGDMALIWLHGLTSSFHFSQTLTKELSSRCAKAGIGYFKFNTRGHNIVARGPKGPMGTAFENFKDCVHDIRTVINSAKRLGYKNIILAGHSTGANKAVYYLYKIRDRSVKGLILIGSLSDIPAEVERVGKREFEKTVRHAKKLYRKSPSALFFSRGFLFSARRYLSLHTPGTPEDVFPYYNPGAKWKELKSIGPSMAVIIGSRDEYLGMPAKKFLEIFQKNAKSAKSFSGIVIKGARHNFHEKEKELAKVIVDWINHVREKHRKP